MAPSNEHYTGWKNVEIRQGLDREEILGALCCSDACVALNPDYLWSPYGFHNSPRKLFEYMACMAPVVTSHRAQMAELIVHGQNDLLCSDESEDILDQLVTLKNNSELSRQLGHAGWQMIQNGRAWQDNVTQSLEVFSDSLSRRSV